MVNIWTVIRYSGRPWFDDKWKTAKDVLEAVYHEASSGGSTHDSAKILMHNSKIIVPEQLTDMAFDYMRFQRKSEDDFFSTLYKKVDELIPYEVERRGKP